LAPCSFPLGFGLAPLFTAPLSEAYGRYPLYFGSALIYLVFFIPIAYGQNIATVIICRFIAGIAASTGSTLVGGTVSDLFEAHNRGLPMAIFSICTSSSPWHLIGACRGRAETDSDLLLIHSRFWWYRTWSRRVRLHRVEDGMEMDSVGPGSSTSSPRIASSPKNKLNFRSPADDVRWMSRDRHHFLHA